MSLRRMGIDLGTTNVRIYLPGKGIAVNEPSVVALETSNNSVVAIGVEAELMLGRTPDSIIAARPLHDGVIANFRIAESMLENYINKLGGRIRLFKPDVMIALPAGVTSTERRALIDACLEAGAKKVYTIKAPIAAALGAGIPITSTSGNMVIDIGGGTAEVAVIALGDIVASNSVRVGGNKIDQAIIGYLKKKHNLIVGEQTAESIKNKIASAIPIAKEMSMEASGSNAITGLPESIIVSTNELVNPIRVALNEIIAAVKLVLQKTPPELSSDVMDKGIVLTGGGALLKNLDQLLSKVTGVPCQVAEDPLLATAKGTGAAVENLDAYKKSVLWAR